MKMSRTRSDARKAARATATKNEFGPEVLASADERIARRAYEIYCERGCEHGHDTEDWDQAERELRMADSHDEDPRQK
jgi:hypothetical protein